MTKDEGYLLARVINALFKGRPGCAFYVFASIIALVLGILLLTAQGRDELTFPVLGLAFILIVVVSHAIHDIKQRQIKDFHGMEETPLESEKDTQEIEEPQQELEPLQLHTRARSNQIMSQPNISPELPRSVILPSPNVEYPNLNSTVDHKDGAGVTRPSIFVTFFKYLVSGPNTIQKTLIEHGLAEASIAASKFSGALFLILNVGSLAWICAIPLLVIASPLLSNPKLGDLFAAVCMAPFLLIVVLIAILMLLSALAALILALLAIFKRAEKKSKSALALLISVLILIVYMVMAIGIIALSG